MNPAPGVVKKRETGQSEVGQSKLRGDDGGDRSGVVGQE